MSNITMEGISALLKEELEPVKTQLNAVTEVLTDHTGTLAALSTDVKTLLDQRTLTDHRLERIENWAQAVGQKVGVKLEL